MHTAACYDKGGHVIMDEYFFFAYSYALTQTSDFRVGPTPRYLLTTYSAQPGQSYHFSSCFLIGSFSGIPALNLDVYKAVVVRRSNLSSTY